MPFIVPEIVPYLFAILGLLLVWQIHQMQVAAGRIQAKNILDRSGVRLVIQVTPDDENTCQACREASGLAMLPSAVVKKKKSSPMHGRCTNPAGCRCQLIGLYGGWARAQLVLRELKANSQAKPLKLSNEKLDALAKSPWQQATNARLDRISMHMLQALRAERNDPPTAVEKYRVVVEDAKSDRDLTFVIPAYMRIVDILERAGRAKEALATITRFEQEFGQEGTGNHSPTHAELEDLSLRKTRLTAALQQVG